MGGYGRVTLERETVQVVQGSKSSETHQKTFKKIGSLFVDQMEVTGEEERKLSRYTEPTTAERDESCRRTLLPVVCGDRRNLPRLFLRLIWLLWRDPKVS